MQRNGRFICIFAGSMERTDTNQYDIIRQLRLPLIVLVTYAHSYNEMTDGYSVLGSGWDMYEVLKLVVSQTLVKAAMPMFFFISGYLFFDNVEKWDWQTYLQKMKRRIKTLLIPYLVWNLLMAVKLRAFSFSIFWEPANMPLWFLRDLIVVSMFTPIIYIGVRKLGWWILLLLLPVYATGIWVIQPGPTPYAVCFFTLGALMSIKKMNIIETFSKKEPLWYLLFTSFGLSMVLTYPTSAFPVLMLCFRLVSIAAVFCFANRILSCTTKRIPQVVCNSSYFIFLAHYVFFLSFIDSAFFSLFGTSTWSLCVHYLLCPLLKAAIFVIVYCLYQRQKDSVLRKDLSESHS